MVITEAHLHLVREILNLHLPKNTTVWVFGSRAHGPTRQFSDLDLLFDQQGKPLPDATFIAMAEAFDNSALPYSVDLVDWNVISEDFKKHIQTDRVLLNHRQPQRIAP